MPRAWASFRPRSLPIITVRRVRLTGLYVARFPLKEFNAGITNFDNLRLGVDLILGINAFDGYRLQFDLLRAGSICSPAKACMPRQPAGASSC